ncbi:hypothetical protein [Chromohalobacter sp. HP20-39]|uniref:hypothetical protein n=1 Tax=Chromohalobacter sp. HP20-39 TaxID=3079306 RepID=UPI00294AA71C|nr:hypothetical protein [Chromohalobacter sp. HP20-39]MDV6318766.1 hypothetical protein [Chromohalobacter sp. HP20-39]
MIAIKEGAVTRLVHEDTRVIDIDPHQRPVYRRIPLARRSEVDKAATPEDVRNGKRAAAYAERLNGVKPAHLQIWSA